MRSIVFFQFSACDWTRANERHFAPHDVVKLGELIDRISPAPSGEAAGDTVILAILGNRDGVRYVLNRSQKGPPLIWLPHRPQL